MDSLKFPTGDVGEAGDKGSLGKAIDGPPGDQGHQGMWLYTDCNQNLSWLEGEGGSPIRLVFTALFSLCQSHGVLVYWHNIILLVRPA